MNDSFRRSCDFPQFAEILEAVPAAFPGVRLEDELRTQRHQAYALGPDLFRPLTRRVSPDESVVFIVSDQTRKTGLDRYLPHLLAAWREAGLREDRIQFLVACGTHRPPTPAEIERIFGRDLAARLRSRIDVHQAAESPVTFVGTTRRGTPVELSEKALEADAVIACGSVLYHYFAGFSGGPKSILPGLASVRTIAANHSLSLDVRRADFAEGVEPGRMQGNPVWEDLAEGAAFLAVRGAVQTVLDAEDRIVCCAVGDLQSAHSAAVESARRTFRVEISRQADVVVAFAGRAPNWVQAHKALVNASRAVREDGVILLAAGCPEGLGSESMRRWLRVGSSEAIVRGLRGTPDINGQTALSTLVRGRRAVLLAGPGLNDEDARLLPMPVVRSLPAALAQCRRVLCREPSIVLPMPEAWLTVPDIVRSRICPE